MYPSLPVVDADPEADRRFLEAIADWCDRYTPLVGIDVPDGLFLDVTGCAHLFGGEAALARDLVTRLAHQGLRARVAVADTVGCAWGIARYGKPGVIPHGETEAAMLPLPIAALRVDPEIVADLKTAGLTCVADLAARPRAPFAARFGKGLLIRLDQALGAADEPITPRLPVPAAMAEQRFPEPIARETDVLGTIEHLARQLAVVLERRGEGGRLIQVALFRADGAVHRLEIGTGSPLRDPVRVRKLFEERLAVLGDACDPGFGYDMVRLGIGRRAAPIRRRPDSPGPTTPKNWRTSSTASARGSVSAASRGSCRRTRALSGIMRWQVRAGACASSCAAAMPSIELDHRRSSAASVCSAGADRRHRPRPRRSAHAIFLAAHHASGRAGRRSGAHRHGMVARRSRQQTHARLFPRRK